MRLKLKVKSAVDRTTTFVARTADILIELDKELGPGLKEAAQLLSGCSISLLLAKERPTMTRGI